MFTHNSSVGKPSALRRAVSLVLVLGLVMGVLSFLGCDTGGGTTFSSQSESSTLNDAATLGLVGTSVSSSNSDVAIVNISDGKIVVTSISEGTANISVFDSDYKEATFTVTVLSDGAITIGSITKYDPDVPVNFDITPKDGPKNTVATLGLIATSASSSDGTIATVDVVSGVIKITPVKAGVAAISAKADGKTAIINITVSATGKIIIGTIEKYVSGGSTPTKLAGHWKLVYGSGNAEWYIITSTTIEYGSSDGVGSNYTANWKGTIRDVEKFDDASGVIIIEYTSPKPEYYDYDYSNYPDVTILDGPFDPPGNFQSVWYSQLSDTTVKICGPYNASEPHGSETTTLAAAKVKFNIDTETDYVSSWSGVTAQTKTTDVPVAGSGNSPALDAKLVGNWRLVYGTGNAAEWYIITSTTIEYGSSDETGNNYTASWKGTIRDVEKFDNASGVIIIEYTSPKPEYYDYDYSNYPDVTILDGPFDPPGNFQSVWYSQLSDTTAKICGPYNASEPYGSETTTLAAAKEKFNIDTETDYVLSWSGVTVQTKTTDVPVAGAQ
ncbi:hypothetical protein [Treponema primitia]|uniref:hypothetical protein n=1 Tax=Treponema primitia TaxID=88058 RepID=UPI0002554F66|nr:hypothetical protein [Treponema primitia]